jgi:hypothetical protein
MNNELNENILNRISKLMAKARSTENEHEHNAFMAKAHELLTQHNLSMSEIDVKLMESRIIEYCDDLLSFGVVKEESDWETLLLSILCRYNYCKPIVQYHSHTNKRLGGVLSIVGERHNCIAVTYLFDVARDKFRYFSKKSFNQLKKDAQDEFYHSVNGKLSELELNKRGVLPYRTVYIRSFLKGCCLGLAKALSEKHTDESSSTDAIDNDGFEVMRLNVDNAIDKYMENQYGDSLNSSGIKFNSQSDAFKIGFEQGNSFELAGGLNGQDHLQMRIESSQTRLLNA